MSNRAATAVSCPNIAFIKYWGNCEPEARIPAIAQQAGVDLPLELFDQLSRGTPLIGNFRPTSPYTVLDLDEAGGIPAVLKIMEPLMHLDLPTVSGETLGQLAAQAENMRPEVLHPLEAPISPEGG